MSSTLDAGLEPTSVAVRDQERESLVWLSWLRVVAISAVVAIHVTGATAVAPDARETIRGQLAIWLNVGSIYAVPLFVMMSGALLLDPLRYRGPREFLRKRAARLVPAVVFWHVWYFCVVRFYLDWDWSVHDALVHAANGKLYTALYFFWIVLGLAVLTPLLVPFIREQRRRGALIAGCAAAAMTALTMATTQWRGKPLVFVESPWTWWIPYLGVFLLGYALRGVILRGWRLGATAALLLASLVVLVWQWRNPDAPALLNELSPPGYYSAGVILYAVLVFVVFQSLLTPGGMLAGLLRPRLNRLGRLLGDATLGVFGLHLTVLLFVLALPEIGGNAEAPRAMYLVLRVLLTIVLTFAIVVPLRRVPLIRAVL